MKFNPITNHLFTDDGALIKELHCPLNTQWDCVDQSSQVNRRDCDGCRRPIYDTAFFQDQDLLQLMEHNPQTCLKVDLNQNNIIVIYE
jgi:hypothetical protein